MNDDPDNRPTDARARFAAHWFEQGRLHERELIAARVADLRESWVARARRTYQQRVAVRAEALRGSVPPPPVRQTEDWPTVAMPGGGR